jgi:two-component system nitrogen regulation response regulator GlnG
MSKPSFPTSISSSSGLGATVHQFLEAYFEDHKGDLPSSGLYQVVLQEIEKPLIEITLKAVEGNQKKASEILGINRNTLRKKMQELGVKSGK